LGVSSTGDQIIIADDSNELIYQVGELAHIASLGFTATERVGTVWKDSTGSNTDKFRLNFDSSSKVGTGNANVSHAAFLIDRFTTLDPGIEDIIPGTINLNTATFTVLSEALPIPNTMLREAVANNIITYRDDPARVAIFNNPGIAHLGELFVTDPKLAALKTPAGTSNDVYQIIDDAAGVKTDFISSINLDTMSAAASALPAVSNRDGVKDDREEAALIARWLSQVGSVRSDYYAAYVLLYEWDWSQALPVNRVTNSSQFIVIFRRNAVSGNVTVAAVYDGNVIYLY